MGMASRRSDYVTADEFLTHPAARDAGELVRGRIRMMSPASGRHGVIAGRTFAALNAFVEPRDLGQCFADNTGFHLPNLVDTVRSPDAAFVRRDHLPPEGIGKGWMRTAPDLAIEVLSPDEARRQLEDKIDDYWAAGTRAVWIVDPDARTVEVREDGRVRRFTELETVDGGPVLSGFTLEIARLFVGIAR